MGNFWWFMVVLTVVIVTLFVLYNCMGLWFQCSQCAGGPQIVYTTAESSRRSIVKESAYISVFYHRNEVKTSDSLESFNNIKSESGEEDDVDKHKMAKWKKIYHIREDQKKTTWNSDNLGCDMLVGTAGNREQIAGYLLDLKNRTCEFYSYGLDVLPWPFDDKEPAAGGDGPGELLETLNEIRSKNLVFCLMLWEDKLKETRKFKLYTDDESIRWPDSKHGSRVRGLLRHLDDCEKLLKMNSTIVLDEDAEMEKFVRFVLPAVDLSHVGIKAFQIYISAAYGIERFDGTHEYIRDEKDEGGEKKAVYMSTKYFDSFKQKVTKRVRTHPSCYSCGYFLGGSPSLQSIGSGDSEGGHVDTGQRKKALIATGNAPPRCTLNRKSRFKVFPPSLKSWGHSGDEHEDFRTNKPSNHGEDLLGSAGVQPSVESEDSASTSSKATSAGCKSSSKSTYSSKGTLRSGR